MPYQTIEVRKSTPNIGAEIAAIDLSKPVSNQQFQDVHDALMENLVIFFREQRLSPERHKEFGLRFGKLHVHPAAPGLSPKMSDDSLQRVRVQEGQLLQTSSLNPSYLGVMCAGSRPRAYCIAMSLFRASST